MIRTQLYVSKELYQRLQLQAQHEHKPTAQLIRELLEAGVTGQRQGSAGDALLRLVAIGGQGPADLSARIDDYLYDDPTA